MGSPSELAGDGRPGRTERDQKGPAAPRAIRATDELRGSQAGARPHGLEEDFVVGQGF